MTRRKSDSSVLSVDTADVNNVSAVSPDDTETKNNTEVKEMTTEFIDKNEEIPVESLISNVSYKDNRTQDIYKWENIGTVEYLSAEIINNMWRNHKGYFTKLWLKPNDKRIINKYKLNKLYDEYEFLMSDSSYVKDNMEDIRNVIKNSSREIKITILNKIKYFVDKNMITDIYVIRQLEKEFQTSLI